MLGRLRITERLGLVLVLPFIAIVLTSVPFAVERMNDARAASVTRQSAGNVRSVGVLIQGLQQERLLLLAYGASTRVERTALISQTADVRELVAQTRDQLGGSASLAKALTGLDSLDEIRAGVLNRTTAANTVTRSYDDVVTTLIDGLRLADSAAVDANRLRELMSLDSLLRANAEADRIGAAVVMAAGDPVAAGQLAASAGIRAQSHTELFRRQADAGYAALVNVGVDGPSARLVRQLASPLTGTRPTPIPVDIGLSAASAASAVLAAIQNDIAGDIAARARDQANAAVVTALTVAGFGTCLLVVVIWLGTAVSRSIARPLRRVTLAATTVAEIATKELTRVTDIESDDSRPPRLAAVSIRSTDEIGELASAFNRVQATAALMMEQQAATRRNVSVMFANIAYRTGGLVARQLAQIDELERGEVDEDRLAKLYRLDHLTTRLRRSADSLLVIAGSRSDSVADAPISLADVIRSAIAQIEGYQAVVLGRVTDVSVTASAAPDLTLLLAELIENATAFSPPGQTVEVSAAASGAGLIHVVDRGIGMTSERLDQENAQFVARERLDIAPTTTLGLLVVGRIARRHGITVRLRPTVGSGVTAEVALPKHVFVAGVRRHEPEPGRRTAINGSATGGRLRPGNPVAAPPIRGAIGPATAPTPPPDRGGLRRRQPGAALEAANEALGRPLAAGAPRHAVPVRDPESERAEISGLVQGLQRAAADSAASTSLGTNGKPSPAPPPPAPPPPAGSRRRSAGEPDLGRPPVAWNSDSSPPPRSEPARGTTVESRAGLQRRRPGEHLDPSLRDEIPGYRRVSSPRQGADSQASLADRNAEAERTALSDYSYGLARASESIAAQDPDHHNDSRSRP